MFVRRDGKWLPPGWGLDASTAPPGFRRPPIKKGLRRVAGARSASDGGGYFFVKCPTLWNFCPFASVPSEVTVIILPSFATATFEVATALPPRL
jgi:hypothetical protein